MPTYFWTTCNQQIQQLWFLNKQWFQFRFDLTETEEQKLYKLVERIEDPIREMRELLWAKEREATENSAAPTKTSSTLNSNAVSA